MKRLFLLSLATLMLAPLLARAQTSFTNESFGIITSPSQIPQSVNNIINHGTISIATPLTFPFETYDTFNWTNTGTMIANPGWQFSNVPLSGNGQRGMGGNFVNLNAGSITGLEAAFTTLNLACDVSRLTPSYLHISATNIINRAVGPDGASLTVGANGSLELTGKNVDLTRSGLQVLPIWVQPIGSFRQGPQGEPPDEYGPDLAIYDEYWAQDSFSEDYALNSDALWDGFVANAPSIPGPPPAGPAEPGTTPTLVLPFPFADSYITPLPNSSGFVTVTNIIGDPTNVTGIVLVPVLVVSNLTKGAVFASVPPGFDAEVGFVGGENFLNGATVLISTTFFNEVTGQDEFAYVYAQDTLAADFDDRGLMANVIGCPPSGNLPLNFLVDRIGVTAGTPGNNGYPAPDFFTSSRSLTFFDPENFGQDSVTNAILEEGDFAGYGAILDNIVSRPPAVPGGTVTNMPGRVRITADNLDMSRTRIRAEGEIVIRSSHLVSSSNAVVDCENLSFNLTSTNGNLNFQNLSKDLVGRLHGTVRMWSAVWENSAEVMLTNNWAVSNIVTTNDMGDSITNMVATQVPLTNTVTMTLHAFMVDGSLLQTTKPVAVYDLVARSTNVVLTDNASVIDSLLIDSDSFTLKGALTIPGFAPPDPITLISRTAGVLRDFAATNAPKLQWFTNEGTLSVFNVAHFGDDRPRPYSAFVNTGLVNAASILLDSEYFENRGVLQTYAPLATAGDLVMRGGTGKLEGGQSTTGLGGNTRILASDVKFANYLLTSGGRLDLMVTNSLTDSGAGSGNVLDAAFGFNVLIKPQAGDLLGTTFRSTAPRFQSTGHSWAGEDRGNSAAGFSNNAAVGTLLLATADIFGGHFFRGAGSQNALYVDLLDISAMGEDYVDQLEIDPSLVIYFAAVNADIALPDDMQAEEYLDGQFGGRLRWASSFAGPNSSADVLLLNGTTIKVNRALRESLIRDDDGDGVANGLDAFPFDEDSWNTTLVVSSTAEGVQAKLSWNAAPVSVYQVEYATNILDLNWQPLMTCTNLDSSNNLMSILDININPAEPQRFYRVRLLQQQ